MATAETPEPGTERNLRSSVKNPRRRQRQSDTDSLRSAPRRKRSKISENSFLPPRLEEDDDEVNGTIEVATVNGDEQPGSTERRGRGRPRKESMQVLDMEIPLRSKKSSVKRPTRGDGAAVLTQNARYSIKMLPSTPKELRREGVEYRGSFGASHHALAITRERAYIWDHTSHAPVTNPRVFDIPFSVKPTDSIPFGALVTTGASSDIGLLILSATIGKIVFFESIERAASLGLFQERNIGIEGTLGSLFSGETVIDVVSAEHAGFIVTMSSGRIVQLTLRDAQGRARVSAQVLRATEQSTGGLFGSIKGLLATGAWKRDVSAVHTRSLGTRGQMQVVSLTEKAELQFWDLDWSGQYRFKGTVDFKQAITEELRRLDLPEMQIQAENVRTLDFAIVEKTSNTGEVARPGAELATDLLVLLKAGSSDYNQYLLAELSLEGPAAVITRLTYLNTYYNRSIHRPQANARLLLPQPIHTALVVFEDAVTVVSLDETDINSPEAQLHASYLQPMNFEDTIYLRQDRALRILDAYEGDGRAGQASSLAFVKGAGLMRISLADPKEVDKEERIPIKSKIEQAVFHGSFQDGNILDFSRIGYSPFSPEEVEQAALAVSDELLRSTSAFISTSPASMDSHLAYKSRALRALVNHVRQNYPMLSKAATWQLLWDAEKVAAAQQLWKAFEDHVAASSQQKRTATILDEACALVRQEQNPQAEVASDNDVVRNFFVHNLQRIEKLLPMACNVLKYLKTQEDKSSQTKIRLVTEAGDLWSKALESVFFFRVENASTYGILPEYMQDGVLTDTIEYAELPEFWTSTESMLKAIVHMAELSRKFASEEWDKVEQVPEVAEILQPMIAQVNSETPRLIQLLCLIYQERIGWLASRPSEKDREIAEKLRINYEKSRYDQFRALAAIGEAESGMRLAEKYKDMQTLTEMVLAEIDFSRETLQEAGEIEKGSILDYLAKMKVRIGKYFERFGDDWANAYFEEGFSGGRAGLMLRDAQENWPEALTRYLRAEPNRAKICWINDITADKDFGHASECLVIAATDQESRLWGRKVELSMAKLALLATQEDLRGTDAAVTERDLQNAMPQSELEIVGIQEQLYRHLLPEIRHCIDHQAELEVAMQKFAFKNQDLHSLRQLLEMYVERVLNHVVLSADELIDVLTLMDSVINDGAEDTNLQGAEFFLALKALNAVAPRIPQDRFETLLQLIWKRCYVYDDWVELNSGQKQSDEELSEKLKSTAPWRTLYHALEQGLFDAADCHIQHLPPSECLGAGCTPEDLNYRWSNADLLDPILHDNKIQDEQLQSYIQDRNLDEWISACVDDVKRAVDEEAEDTAQRLKEEREFEESLKGTNVNGSTANGHAKGPNGMPDIEHDDGEDDGRDEDADTDAGVELE